MSFCMRIVVGLFFVIVLNIDFVVKEYECENEVDRGLFDSYFGKVFLEVESWVKEKIKDWIREEEEEKRNWV